MNEQANLTLRSEFFVEVTDISVTLKLWNERSRYLRDN